MGHAARPLGPAHLQALVPTRVSLDLTLLNPQGLKGPSNLSQVGVEACRVLSLIRHGVILLLYLPRLPKLLKLPIDPLPPTVRVHILLAVALAVGGIVLQELVDDV